MIGPFEVLDAATQEGRARWLRLWSTWPDREVSAHPSYVALFARECDRSLAVTCATAHGGILLPLIERPLSIEPWAGAQEQARDLTSPYGYGGPFMWGATAAEVVEFWAAFEAWAPANGIATTFMRLSLFQEQLAAVSNAEPNTPNVVRSLDLSPDAIWRDYAHKVRKNVTKARAAGVSISVDLVGERLDEFVAIYHSTMDRRGAAQGYYFSREFFANLVSSLSGQYAFFHALQGGAIVSTELVLVSALHIYSFLGGTHESAFDARPNDLLKHEVIEWGRAQGKRAFVLGGGYGGPDGIFRYKLAFAPHGERTFHVAKMVHSAQNVQRLLHSRAAWESAEGRSWSPAVEFFPPYRAPHERPRSEPS